MTYRALRDFKKNLAFTCNIVLVMQSYINNHQLMIKNYLLIAARILVKNKVFSLINIAGLATGITCCVLITLFILDELSYEKGFGDRDRVFRINTTFFNDGNQMTSGHTSPPIATELAESLPEIEHATRVVRSPSVEKHIVRYKDKSFFETGVLWVDSTFLDVFDYALVKGNPQTALDGPSAALISHRASKKIFGEADPVDELLIINSGTSADTFRVTGVLAPTTFPSHLDADFYLCMNSNGLGRWMLGQTTWANNNMVGSYLKLRDPRSAVDVNTKMNQMLEARAGEELRQSGRAKILSLQPLERIRLFSGSARSVGVNQSQGGGITYIYIIGTIGAFILLLACINFMNLTTARSAQRAGEVGIRKSMGAHRQNLIAQFLGESFVIVGVAVVLSLVMIALALPLFNAVIEKQLAFNAGNLPVIILSAVVIAFITALLAGGYPAFFMSSMKPTQVLKGKALVSGGSQWLRKSLVVFQFVITITLISSIVIIQQQLKYIQSKSLGFDTEQVVMIPMRSQAASSEYLSLKNSFEAIPGVHSVSAASSLPSTPLFRDWLIYKDGWNGDQALRHEIVSVDEDYFKVIDVPLLAGRDFIPAQDNQEGDSLNPTKVIVNEASLRALEIPLDEAIGHGLSFNFSGEINRFTIIGVVRDFHQFSLHQEISPMLFMLPSDRTGFPYMAASVAMSRYSDIRKIMKATWDNQVAELPFEEVFLNQNIQTMYKEEQRISALLTLSTTIAVLISCLGLYGLSVYVAERKTKEIGVRKVVGASVGNIVSMLSREYILLILISFLIAAPLGYYAMDKWLQEFAYKITPGITVFLISGVISFAIAWFTVSFESFRAANRNPVDTLRN